MLSQKAGVPSFLLLRSIPLCKWTSFLIHSFAHQHLGCFQHLAIVNSVAMNVRVLKFFGIGDLGFLGYIPSSGIAGSKSSSFLIFWGNSILLSTVAAPVCIPTNSALGLPFSAFLPALTVCWFINDHHSDRSEVISHCAFNVHLSDG